MACLEGGWCIAVRKIPYQQRMACTARGGGVFWGSRASAGSIAEVSVEILADDNHNMDKHIRGVIHDGFCAVECSRVGAMC